MSSDKIAKLLDKLIPESMQEINAYKRTNYSDGQLRLDAMESPYGFSSLPPQTQDEWLQIVQKIQVNRYPPVLADEDLTLFRNFIKQTQQMHEGRELPIVLGNGSDELILLLCLLCGIARGGKVLSPTPSFSMYSHITKALGGEFVGCDLEDDFSLDLDKFADAIKKHRPQLIFIAQPNNPTGNLFKEEAVALAAQHNQDNGMVLVDRAYNFFCDDFHRTSTNGKITQICDYDNLLELQTFSKIGIAGLRIGFLIGHPLIIEQLEKLRLPYNINSLSMAAIGFLLRNIEHFKDKSVQIIKMRDELAKQMQDLCHKDKRIEVFPSSCNFLLFRHQAADACYDYLRQHKVLIKNLNKAHPLLDSCLRVSIGTQEENNIFLDKLKSFLAKN